MQIITDRLIINAAPLQLIATELAFLKAETNADALAQMLGAQIITWPPLYYDAEACAFMLDNLTQHPEHENWGPWHILLKRERALPILVCSAGFHGPPDAEGSVEIGYSVIDEYQRQGIAPETVAALTQWAFSHPQVNQVTITTLDTPELLPSSKVAQKSGFTYVGTRPSDEGTLLVYAMNRKEYTEKYRHKYNTGQISEDKQP